MYASPETCDVVVAGAGPAGAASAIALAQRGLSVVLLDVANRRRPSPGESLHGVAASSLRELGVWPRFLDQAARPSHLSEIAWESAVPRERRAIDSAWGPEWHLERERFDRWLCSEADRCGANRVQCLAIEAVRFDRSAGRFRWSVRTAAGSTHVESRALIDATGRSAAVVRRFGSRFIAPDQLLAVSQVYDQPLAHPSVLIEAAAHGWCYSAPLPRNRSLAIWFTDTATARRHVSEHCDFDAALLSTVQTYARVGALKSDAPSSMCAAGPSLTRYDSAIPMLPVGDAAVAFDPISGDGLCFALRSALDAAEALDRVFSGQPSALAAYASGVEAVFIRHVTRRAALYHTVSRFGNAPFWTRRRLPALETL